MREDPSSDGRIKMNDILKIRLLVTPRGKLHVDSIAFDRK